MSEIITVEVPDIGDFENVEIIDVLVSAGNRIAKEDSLITLESDKASVEIPSPRAGVIKALQVCVGERVSKGDPIVRLQVQEPAPAAKAPESVSAPTVAPAAGREMGVADMKTELVVLGSGPGGYTAAFRAADLGKAVTLIERYSTLGGVCLNVGCIPSKALLHVAQVISEAAHFATHGVTFGAPEIDLPKLASWKDKVVGRLTGGIAQLAKQRKVAVVQGVGRFTSAHHIEVQTPHGNRVLEFEQAIIAAGSQPARLPIFPWDDPRVMDSTDALKLEAANGRLLVVGGGIIGLEMATVYHALGAAVSVCELTDGLIPGCDRDLIRPLEKRIKNRYESIFLGTKVTACEPASPGLRVAFEGGEAPAQDTFDRVLVATGRTPNGHKIGAEQAGVDVDEQGFITVDSQQRTNVPHIFAIGDIVGQPMLAHKATHEGKVAAEVCAGMKSHFDARTVPSVAYTDPEVAWMGLTETEAKAQGIAYEKGVFPWAASGRSLSLDRAEGLTKLLFDENRCLIGAGIVGTNAGDLIAETVLALEMGADAEDIGLTIHPHPTLSETVCFAAEMAQGTITDLYAPRKKN